MPLRFRDDGHDAGPGRLPLIVSKEGDTIWNMRIAVQRDVRLVLRLSIDGEIRASIVRQPGVE